MKDEGDFDLMTVDGLLSHIAHCDQEIEDGVRDGLNEWHRRAVARAAGCEQCLFDPDPTCEQCRNEM